MLVDTPLLVVGTGPAALVVAKGAAAYGLPTLLVGHEPTGDSVPVALDPDAGATLEQQALLDVLRPYLVATEPVTIAPLDFEEVIKHHCVADLNVTVYDDMAVVERVADGGGVRGVLTDGTSRWDVHADQFVDATALPGTLAEAITAGTAAALDAVAAIHPA